MWGYIARSTLKREAASVVMAWLLGVATFMIITAETFEQRLQILSMFTLPVMAIFTGAFGADFIAKQTNIAGGPQGADGSPKEADSQGDGVAKP